MTILDRVKELAKEKGYSLTQVNDLAGFGTNVLYSWKTRTPSVEKVKAVADVLNVSVDFLLGNTDEKNPRPAKDRDNKNEIDLNKVAKEDSWDNYLSSNGRPLSDQDKKVLRALFGDD